MKKIYTLVMLMVFALRASATIHTVSVADFSFSPVNVNAVCGDTVRWTWVSGTHTTTSTSVPCGPGWNASITASATSFNYVLPLSCAGTYSYNCALHPTMMQGTITVTCASGMDELSFKPDLLFPNPFTERISVTPNGADRFVVYDILGNIIKEAKFNSDDTYVIDLAELPQGTYFLRMYSKGIVTRTRKISKI